MTDSFETNLKNHLHNIPAPAPRSGLAADIINTAKATPQAFTLKSSRSRFWQDFARPQWLVTAATLLLFGVLLGYQLHEFTGPTGAGVPVEAANNIAVVDDLLLEEIYTLEAFDEAIWG